MRYIATVAQPASEVKRLMIHDSPDGVYLFGFDNLTDGGALWDEWYETLADAQVVADTQYAVSASDWQIIPDPLENCQQEWITPVRIKGRNEGTPQWGQLERLENGIWVDFTDNSLTQL